jgi:Fic family protein
MNNEVYNFKLNIDWELINLISKIDRFDANWTAIERKEGQSLKELKSIATVRSVGASNRIEGNKMSDEEVYVLLQKLDVTKLTDRDSQEVVGYFEVLDLISEYYENSSFSESHIKSLHHSLMKYSAKDQWHKGNYKQHNNAVEASFPDGTRQIIFQTTEAGFATEDAIRQLLNWYDSETEVHPLVKVASFVYDFLSVHPFQDGNGRLSRLISTFLLLKNGYKWIQYVSFEQEIENRKNEYYHRKTETRINLAWDHRHCRRVWYPSGTGIDGGDRNGCAGIDWNDQHRQGQMTLHGLLLIIATLAALGYAILDCL